MHVEVDGTASYLPKLHKYDGHAWQHRLEERDDHHRHEHSDDADFEGAWLLFDSVVQIVEYNF